MQLALAQVAALVANGNAWLAGDTDAAGRVQDGTTFQYVRSIRFERQEGTPAASTAAQQSVEDWYRRLAESGVSALWQEPRPLAAPTLPPQLAAAFADGSRPSIVTQGREPRVRWIPSWTIAAVPTPSDKRG